MNNLLSLYRSYNLAVVCKRFYIPASIPINNVDKKCIMNNRYLSISTVLSCVYEGVGYIETFSSLNGYENDYEISNFGRIKSIKFGKEKIITPFLIKGYYHVNLSKNGIATKRTIHQLIAVVFHNHTPCGMEKVVDHKNNIKTDNFFLNIQLTTNRINSTKDRVGKTSSFVGVDFHKRTGKWRSRIHIDGKVVHLGYFDRELSASFKYLQETNKLIKS